MECAKKKLLDCINIVAPLKKFKERPREIAPWAGEELLEKVRVRDYYFSKSQNSNTSLDPDFLMKFKQCKTEKMKDYFLSKK